MNAQGRMIMIIPPKQKKENLKKKSVKHKTVSSFYVRQEKWHRTPNPVCDRTTPINGEHNGKFLGTNNGNDGDGDSDSDDVGGGGGGCINDDKNNYDNNDNDANMK